MGRNIRIGLGACALAAILSACASKVASQSARGGDAKTTTPAPTPAATAATPPEPPPDPADVLARWLEPRLPRGGKVTREDGGAIGIAHTVTPGDTARSIAAQYLDLTDIYWVKDLAEEISKRYPHLASGDTVQVPGVLRAPYRTPEADRLRWPEDRALKGIYLTAYNAGVAWPETIAKLAARNLNAVVLDTKDWMGPITYPTHVKLALDTGTGRYAPIHDLARAIRFAHASDVHVIARISCFHDPMLASRAPRLAFHDADGNASATDWVNPAKLEVQTYVVDVVREVIEQGVDEIQLDYVRFPVQDTGGAILPLADGHRTETIRAFVRRVHEVTEAAHVPLSLDVFGIAATGGDALDIEKLGQNLRVIGAEAEAVSPMVYPSHYEKGFYGFQEPGDHPEIVGIGTRAAVAKLKDGNVGGTIVRPWLQANNYLTSNYSPKYIQDEICSAEASGATGWLLWNASNLYGTVWDAIPVVKKNGG